MTSSALRNIDMYETQLTTTEAAELASVDPAVIRQWKARGYLPACATDRAGRPRFHGIDVAAAELRTRRTKQSRRAA